jgi:hypothetical protein
MNSTRKRGSRRYWASRPDKDNLDLYWSELQQGRLRQGWGRLPEQNLDVISNLQETGGESWWEQLTPRQNEAYRNYPFHPFYDPECFLQGDFVLLPNMPYPGKFSLVEIVDNVYRYEDILGEDDYRHCRAVHLLTPSGIPNDHPDVVAGIQSTLRCRSRIWRIDHLAEDVVRLIGIAKADGFDAEKTVTFDDRYNRIRDMGRKAAREPARQAAKEQVELMLDTQFRGEGFEVVIKNVLEKLFPGCSVQSRGGRAEVEHGTDLLVRMENPFNRDEPFLIPVQVKMHSGTSEDGVAQLEKAAHYWEKEGQVIALALINTAELSDSTLEELRGLEKKTGRSCYYIDRKVVVDFIVDSILGDLSFE